MSIIHETAKTPDGIRQIASLMEECNLTIVSINQDYKHVWHVFAQGDRNTYEFHFKRLETIKDYDETEATKVTGHVISRQMALKRKK